MRLTYRKYVIGIVIGMAWIWVAVPGYTHAATTSNLIGNPSVENGSVDPRVPTAWYQDGWGQNTAVFAYPVAGYEGDKGIKTGITQYTDGDAKWYPEPILVSGGQQYTFSDYYIADVVSSIDIQYQLQDGSYRYVNIIEQLPAASSWTRVAQTFTVPTDYPSPVVNMTVFHLIASVGSLTTDAYDLQGVDLGVDPIPPPVSPSTGTLIVTKHVINDNGGSRAASAFTLHVKLNGVEVVGSPLAGLETGVTLNLPVGTYTINEDTVSGYTQTGMSGECNASGSIAVTASTTVRCLVTNDDIPPTPPPPPPLPPDTNNLINNASVETASASDPAMPAGWYQGGWGANTHIFPYPVLGYDGAKAVKTEITSYTSGDAKWYFEPVAVSGGERYTFSDYYISNAESSLDVRYQLQDGTYRYPNIVAKLPAASAWTPVTQVFTVPTNYPSPVVSMTIFHYIESVGSLTTDNFVLKKLPSDTFSSGMISLNFDDGPISVYQNAIPLLNATGIHSTQYIVSGFLGDPDNMNQVQVQAMYGAGHEIGVHTRTHSHLTQLTQAQLNDEIIGAKNDLVALGVNPTTFAYPYGEFNDTIEQTVKNAGFRGARSVLEGFNTKSTNPYELLDQHVESNVTMNEIKGWIDQALKDKTWLILEMHDIDHSGQQYSTTPEILQQIIDYIQLTHIAVVTESQGLAVMGY